MEATANSLKRITPPHGIGGGAKSVQNFLDKAVCTLNEPNDFTQKEGLRNQSFRAPPSTSIAEAMIFSLQSVHFVAVGLQSL